MVSNILDFDEFIFFVVVLVVKIVDLSFEVLGCFI